MYSTCLHCHRSLGANDAIEHLPIGKRLAFDSFKGRLWVVCQHCSRWNLTSIEERWEAVEESEALFRSQRIRAQTDNIGLVRVRDGTVLIRVGKPLRPEFAAWRYGSVFGRRMRNRIAVISGGSAIMVATGALTIGSPVIGFGALVVGLSLMGSGAETRTGLRARGVIRSTRVAGEDGKILAVTRANLEHTSSNGPPRFARGARGRTMGEAIKAQLQLDKLVEPSGGAPEGSGHGIPAPSTICRPPNDSRWRWPCTNARSSKRSMEKWPCSSGSGERRKK
jgi:hypothetical protein